MLVSNDCYPVTCQSCCYKKYNVDHHKKAADRADLMSYKCVCKLTTCSHDASQLREATTFHENYHQCCQSPDRANVTPARDLPCESVTSDSRRLRCSCRPDAQIISGSVSAAHCAACVCHHRSKPETLIHVVQSATSHNYSHHCCTVIDSRSPDFASYHQSVVLPTACPACANITQVNRHELPDTELTFRHSESDLQSIQQTPVRNPRPVQSGSVIMDVNEWQRRHIEHLGRQKLEVYDNF